MQQILRFGRTAGLALGEAEEIGIVRRRQVLGHQGMRFSGIEVPGNVKRLPYGCKTTLRRGPVVPSASIVRAG